MVGDPDTLANPVAWRGLALLVGIGSLAVGKLEEGKEGLVQGELAGADEGLNKLPPSPGGQ